ncbi:hypothetical protein [Streptomyces gilvus]|uniref:hypothetical protein n=1 Tax=Streptomyces gilvus TaxID=2920937 RepID=UPI001F111E86|nr:hypothetical protein [Streptomyces sp. CME 23]MCH5677356.1 hypothetical protein [Streptomyces sp. CME 23]
MGDEFEPGADATLAIDQVSAWIISADTKAGLLAASLGVLVAGLLTQASALRGMAPPHTVRQALILLLAHLTVISTMVSAWFVLRTLAPRTVTSTPTRYGWPSLARTQGPVTPAAEPGRARAEAWQHAVDLAAVAELKFASFRRALSWAVGAGGGLVALLFVIVWT